MSLGHHLILRLADDRVIATNDSERRILARVVLKAARPYRLLAFRAADSHMHGEVAGSRRETLELARRVEIGLRLALRISVPFERARVKPITDQWHRYNTFRYTLGQEQHHRISSDPFFEASNLPDLLGLRLIGAFTRRHVDELLPRVSRKQLLMRLGAPELDECDTRVDLEHLVEAACAALALPSLESRRRDVVVARVAAVRAVEAIASIGEIADALAIDPCTVRRLRESPPPPREVVRAIVLQARLRVIARNRGELRTPFEPQRSGRPGLAHA